MGEEGAEPITRTSSWVISSSSASPIAGTFRFKKRLLFIANPLKQHTIGLAEVDDGIWSIHFCNVLLRRMEERDDVIRA